MTRRGVAAGVLAALLLLAPAAASAADPLASATGIGVTGSAGAPGLSVPMRIALSLTLLTFLPAVIVALTPFLRITIVLHFLRQALGTQSTPSNQILIGLALFLSLLIMQPIGKEVYQNAWLPLDSGKITAEQAMAEAIKPLKTFQLRFTREKDLQLFLEMSKTPAPKTPADLDFTVVAPAYIISELKAGFQIGAVLYLPFLIIDVAVASITLCIGMIQLPPVMISAPFKILLFVLVDGWNLVIGSLVKTFYVQ